MSSQFNDPPNFGGLVNANIRANRDQALNLVSPPNDAELPTAPTLVGSNLAADFYEVALIPLGYPGPLANVVFKYRLTGTTGAYTNFTSSSFLVNPVGNGQSIWVGTSTGQLLPGTSYDVIATSGIFFSPTLRIVTGSPASDAPDNAPTPPVALVVTATTITAYFNGGFTGGALPLVFTLNYRDTGNYTAIPAVASFGSLYVATITGLTASTAYYLTSTVTNAFGSETSAITNVTTSAGSGTAPTPAPPTTTVTNSLSTSLTFNVTGATTTGTPTPSFGVNVSTNALMTNSIFIAGVGTAGNYNVVALNLTPSTNYYAQAIFQNGVAPAALGPIAGPFPTNAGPTPTGPLKTNLVMPFLIQGPRFNVPYSQALDYYINVDAVGCFYTVGGAPTAQGNQLYGSMYGASTVANGSGKPDLTGFCIADQPYNEAFGPTNDAYLRQARRGGSRLLTSWGGFYADILGLFGPYQPPGYPGAFGNPTSINVVKSFLYNFCGITTNNTNPLNWRRSGYTTYLDGLVLDFECVGYGGNPNVSNQYPLPQTPAPVFPASAALATYSDYPQALADIVITYYSIAPTLFLGNAPVSLSINGDTVLGVRAGNICAANTALNTWFAFTSSTVVPSNATYNATASLALNHPVQMSYFDDIFVQFYNENAVNYLGGANFPILLAQWGFVALKAQALGRKKTTINIGLANGDIIPGFGANGAIVPNVQGPTPQLDGEPGPPYTYWYPQYGTASPPNKTSGSGQTWPNTGPTLDGPNLASAISQANSILQVAFSNPTLQPSDWCSGCGFWAAGGATRTATAVYSGTRGSGLSPGPILPAQNVYLWSDASYPSPDPLWNALTTQLPVENNL
jgi:hypothetical protein